MSHFGSHRGSDIVLANRQAVNNSSGFQHVSNQLVSIETSNSVSNQQAQSRARDHSRNKKMNATQRNSELIKVCVRVRPLLPREMAKDEVVYFPSTAGDPDGLEVSSNPTSSFMEWSLTDKLRCAGHQNRRRSAHDREQVRQGLQPSDPPAQHLRLRGA